MTTVTISLEKAYLCLDCETISDDGRSCGFCGSIALHSLAKFINRATDDNSIVLIRSLAHTCDTTTVPCIACSSSHETSH
jgi:hypothetical protein